MGLPEYLGDEGPAVRERVYSHAQDSDRLKMDEVREAIDKSTNRTNDLESALASYSSELTGDRAHTSKMNDALRDLRNDIGSSLSLIHI